MRRTELNETDEKDDLIRGSRRQTFLATVDVIISKDFSTYCTVAKSPRTVTRSSRYPL